VQAQSEAINARYGKIFGVWRRRLGRAIPGCACNYWWREIHFCNYLFAGRIRIAARTKRRPYFYGPESFASPA